MASPQEQGLQSMGLTEAQRPQTRLLADLEASPAVVPADEESVVTTVFEMAERDAVARFVDGMKMHWFIACIFFIVVYLLTFVLFVHVHGNDLSIGDSLYFLVTTITTVGYGDDPYVFKGKTEKIFAIIFVLIGVGFVGIALGNVLAYFADSLESIGKNAIKHIPTSSRRRHEADGLGDSPPPHLRRECTIKHLKNKCESRLAHLRHHVAKQWAILILTLIVGTIGIKLLEDADPEPKDSKISDWVDALYFVVVTATTLGLGDLTPSTPAAKAWTCGLILCSFAAVANALSSMAAFPLEWRQQREEFSCVTQFGANLHQDSLDSMLHSDELLDIRHGGIREGFTSVSRAEFMLWLFLKQGRIDTAHIEDAVWAFDLLDTDGSGELNAEDVRGAVERHGRQNAPSKDGRQ